MQSITETVKPKYLVDEKGNKKAVVLNIKEYKNKSISLMIKHNLRTLGSLQLSVFLDLSSLNPTMVTSDEALFNATLKEGISAIKP